MPNTTIDWLWWGFSTIIIAVVINIISDYTKTTLNKSFENYSRILKIKNEKKQKNIEEKVNKIIENPLLIHKYNNRLIFLYIYGGVGMIVVMSSAIIYYLFRLNSNPVTNLNSSENFFLSQRFADYFMYFTSLSFVGGGYGYIKNIREIQNILNVYWSANKEINGKE